MPRYIDADAFIVDSIKNKRFVFHTEDIINDAIIVETVYGDLLDAINNMPTIDAVEVVRCKDCEHFAGYTKHARIIHDCDGICTLIYAYVAPERRKRRYMDYCSNGKREIDAEVENASNL